MIFLGLVLWIAHTDGLLVIYLIYNTTKCSDMVYKSKCVVSSIVKYIFVSLFQGERDISSDEQNST